MLGADLLGFHTFSYLRHFRSSALRLLGVEAGITHLRCADGHHADLGVYPIGIHAKKFDETLDDPSHLQRQEKFRATYQGKQIILSVERMDYTKGILRRLEAVDCFLANREARNDLKFIFVSVPSREGVEEYRDLREDVESRIGRLNGKYATLHNSPIHFIHDSVEFAELCALYSVADACMVTPLIDGMNLVAKEFLACQRVPTGPLILSEFAGAAEELSSALIVNPYDPPAVAASIDRALAMPDEEVRERNVPMRERVMRLDAGRWAKNFLDDLSAITGQKDTQDAPKSVSDASTRIAQTLALGGSIGWFLDYDGTLRDFEKNPQTAKPDPELLGLLRDLAARSGCEVTIISGRSRADLDAFFGGQFFGLIAEHGAFRKLPGTARWEGLDESADYAWKDEVRRILHLYKETVPGSLVEEKRTSLVWHYRKAEEGFGVWKANQLTEELGAMVSDAPVQVRHGHKIVEVVSSRINKGEAVRQDLLGKEYQLVVCVGDDRTDESMFELADDDRWLSVKVGGGVTHAKYRVADPAALRAFLRGVLPQH